MRWHAAVAGVSAVVFALSLAFYRQTRPITDHGAFSGSLEIPYIHTIPAGEAPVGVALVVHGLDSNKEFMQLLAMAMTDAGFETWSIDLPGHGDSPERFDSPASLRAIRSSLDALPENTIVVGHSLGAGLLAELAMSHPVPTMVLLSPPPIPVSRLRVSRLLIISGGFDAPRIDESIPALLEHAGGGAEWRRFPWAAHSSVLYNPIEQRSLVEWIGGRTSALRTTERLFWIALMGASLIGLAVAVWLRLDGKTPDPDALLPMPASTDVIARVGALGAAVAILTWVSPLGWLHVFRTDYLIGIVLISGLILWRGRGFRLSLPGLATALGAVGALLLAVWLAGSTMARLVPSGEQWLRFPVLTAAFLPLCLYDERVLRSYPPMKMWGMFLLSRALIWAAIMTGVLIFSPESVFMVLIVHFIAVGWIPVWWLAGLVARASGEPASAALFTALFLGWVFAALFVTI